MMISLARGRGRGVGVPFPTECVGWVSMGMIVYYNNYHLEELIYIFVSSTRVMSSEDK